MLAPYKSIQTSDTSCQRCLPAWNSLESCQTIKPPRPIEVRGAIELMERQHEEARKKSCGSNRRERRHRVSDGQRLQEEGARVAIRDRSRKTLDEAVQKPSATTSCRCPISGGCCITIESFPSIRRRSMSRIGARHVTSPLQ